MIKHYEAQVSLQDIEHQLQEDILGYFSHGNFL